MLWVNLIMDVLGAIALGTESPRDEGDTRISRKDGIVNSVMLRNILLMSLYQIIIMLIFMYFGEMMLFKKSFNLITAPLRDQETEKALDPLVLGTIQFYIFVLMNLFNQFNCRIVVDKEFNIFADLWKNYFFIIVVAFEFFLTWLMVDIGATTIGSSLIGTANLTPMDHLICWCVGASTLLVGVLIKLVPIGKFESIIHHFDLEDETGGKLNALHNKALEA